MKNIKITLFTNYFKYSKKIIRVIIILFGINHNVFTPSKLNLTALGIITQMLILNTIKPKIMIRQSFLSWIDSLTDPNCKKDRLSKSK